MSDLSLNNCSWSDHNLMFNFWDIKFLNLYLFLNQRSLLFLIKFALKPEYLVLYFKCYNYLLKKIKKKKLKSTRDPYKMSKYFLYS